MTWPIKKFGESIKIDEMLEKRVKRGRESWEFFYSIFGILIAIARFVISILPINWRCKLLIFIICLLILIWICFISAWWQNKLIGLKIKLEETWRKI